MGSKSSDVTVTCYHMSIHYGVCAGPVDRLNALYIGGEEAWTGEVTEKDKIVIDRPSLFGGELEEGGPEGVVHFFPGDTEQTIPDDIAERFGRTEASMPGFRGICSLMFVEEDAVVSELGIPSFVVKGFLWQKNNPYLPDSWVNATRISKGLPASTGTIQIGEGQPESNPAHIIYESLTNTDWGIGLPAGNIDGDMFTACAQTLFDESFGISILWDSQDQIEDFVNLILNHIQATLFVNPRTGLLSLKLIRADYEKDDLPVINPDNCQTISRQRKAWGDTVNEIVVTWTNPESEEEETVTVQDSGNIAMQGGIVSDTRDYGGIRRGDLAIEVGARDLRAAAAPLLSVEVEINRDGWDLLPGDVFIYQWPEDGLESLIMRITNINYGKPGEPTIKVTAIEDVFSNDPGTWSSPPSTGWVDPSEAPSEMEHKQFYTVPFPPLVTAGAATADDPDAEYPRVVTGFLASHHATDVVNFVLYGDKVVNTGETYVGNLGSKYLSLRSELLIAWEKEVSTVVASFGQWTGNRPLPAIGDYLVLGYGGDAECEWCVVESYDVVTGFVIIRGVYDTVPHDWPIGTPCWVCSPIEATTDLTEHIAGETTPYYIRTRTSKGVLPLADTPVDNVTLTSRPYCPFRPANITIEGVAFEVPVFSVEPVSVSVTWANRSRLVEDALVRRWNEGNVTPEIGQTTTIRVTTEWGALLWEVTGLTGTAYDIPYDAFDYERYPQVAFYAERDGLESIQGGTQTVAFELFGYGHNYGNDYGGTLGG